MSIMGMLGLILFGALLAFGVVLGTRAGRRILPGVI